MRTHGVCDVSALLCGIVLGTMLSVGIKPLYESMCSVPQLQQLNKTILHPHVHSLNLG